MAAIAVLALMVLAVVPAVSADTDNGRTGEKNQGTTGQQGNTGNQSQYGDGNQYGQESSNQFHRRVEEMYARGMQSYSNAKMNYQNSQGDWQSARDEFQQAMSRWRSDKTDSNFSQLVSASKHSADKAAEMMIRSMEMVRARIEATLGMSENEKNRLYNEIDNYISEVRAKQLSIQNAGDKSQIRAAAGELHQYWLQIRMRLQQINGEAALGMANVVLQRVEAFAARVEARIQLLKDNGVDTSNYENLLANLRLRIEAARQLMAQAENGVERMTDNEAFMESSREARRAMKQAMNYLKDALNDLKGIVQESRRRGHNITIEGSGTLTAEGNGRVEITGTGTVRVLAPIDGSVLVTLNATVTTNGDGTTESFDNNWVQYQGYDNLIITGTDMTVIIAGKGIDIIASGTGVVRLSGRGIFSTYGENSYVDDDWEESETSVTLQTGEAA